MRVEQVCVRDEVHAAQRHQVIHDESGFDHALTCDCVVVCRRSVPSTGHERVIGSPMASALYPATNRYVSSFFEYHILGRRVSRSGRST
jgi:hypothetical protein